MDNLQAQLVQVNLDLQEALRDKAAAEAAFAAAPDHANILAHSEASQMLSRAEDRVTELQQLKESLQLKI
jgi:hypothetical protein